MQTGTANKRSVYVGQSHQFGYIVRFDATSIQDSNGFCKHVPEIGVLFVLKLARLMSQRIRSTSGALVEALEEVKP